MMLFQKMLAPRENMVVDNDTRVSKRKPADGNLIAGGISWRTEEESAKVRLLQ
jgi:hypothetical protein